MLGVVTGRWQAWRQDPLEGACRLLAGVYTVVPARRLQGTSICCRCLGPHGRMAE